MSYARFLAACPAPTELYAALVYYKQYTCTPYSRVSCCKSIGHSLYISFSVCEYLPVRDYLVKVPRAGEHWCSKRAIRDDDRDRDGGGGRMAKEKIYNK